MELIIKRKAQKDLEALDKTTYSRVLKRIQLLCENDLSNVKQLTNFQPKYRARVGNYRILFNKNTDESIEIFRVLHRKNAYEK